MSIHKKPFILAFVIILLVILGILDYYTGFEISFSIFYLIPISILSLRKDTKLSEIIFISFFSAIVWLIADILDFKIHSLNFIPFWNAIVRLLFFLSISLLINKIIRIDHKKLISANNELEKLNEEKNLLLGIAAHDLRNSIGHIKSFSELLIASTKLNNSFSDDDKECVEIIYNSSINTLMLLTNLLDFTKIQSGTVKLNFQKYNYINFIKNGIKINHLLAVKKNIEVIFETIFESLMVEYDESSLYEVFNNLLSNAIKYSFQDSKIIIRVNKNQDKVLTEILDTGVGIRVNEINDLFKPFKKASSKPTANEPSTGLGLAIAKKIITLHNGSIGVKSEFQKGSNFYYYLPIV